MTGGGLISVEEALARVLASAREPLGEESVALGDALGRTLARDVRALRTQPPFANSAMDGYALRAADAAQPAGAARGDRRVGGRPRLRGTSLAAGQAVRIFTGAPMPDGRRRGRHAGGGAARRRLDRASGRRLARATTSGRAASTSRRARRCSRAGRRLTARDVALAAAANHAKLVVRRRPRVAILATGDELVAPGEALGPAQIVASNNFAVAGVVAAAGGEPIDLGIAADDAERARGEPRAGARGQGRRAGDARRRLGRRS